MSWAIYNNWLNGGCASDYKCILSLWWYCLSCLPLSRHGSLLIVKSLFLLTRLSNPNSNYCYNILLLGTTRPITSSSRILWLLCKGLENARGSTRKTWLLDFDRSVTGAIVSPDDPSTVYTLQLQWSMVNPRTQRAIPNKSFLSRLLWPLLISCSTMQA